MNSNPTRTRAFVLLWIFGTILWNGGGESPARDLVSEKVQPAPPKINRVHARGPLPTDPVTAWNIVFSTSEVGFDPGGLSDFAKAGEKSLVRWAVSSNPIANVSPEAPLWDGEARTNPEGTPYAPFWTGVVPATFTLTFDPPFVLERIDLQGWDRRGGFSDFEFRVRNATEEKVYAPVILAATVAAGVSPEDAFRWSLQIEPTHIREAAILFKRGTNYIPKQVFLYDLDLWGRRED